MLDLTPFRNALNQLSLVLEERARQPANDFIRDSLIQRFEFTYELSHKMLRRYLVETEPTAKEIHEMSLPNLIRRGSERGLMLNGWDKWHGYWTARNQTSHGYDKEKADGIAAIVPEFYYDARYLFDQMTERLSA